MRTLANILWHVPFLGFVSSFAAFLIGGFFVLTLIGAPIGLGMIQLSKFLLAPFSNVMISKSDLKADQNVAWKTFGIIVRIFYFPFGLFLAGVIIFQTALLFMTVIGIPVALVLAKSLSTFFNPIDKICVSKTVADAVATSKIQAKRAYNS